MDLSSFASLERLRQSIQQLPGIGPKAASRIVLHVLGAPEKEVEALKENIVLARERMGFCVQCNGFVEDADVCQICQDGDRSDAIICVVEDPVILLMLEARQKARWKYHVTHGLVSPLDGCFPKDLKLSNFWSRMTSRVEELIVAFSTSMEGEATAMYVHEEVSKRLPNVRVSRIAHGVPFGTRLDGVDGRTLIQAIDARRPMVLPS